MKCHDRPNPAAGGEMIIFEDVRTYDNIDAFWEALCSYDSEETLCINQQLVARIYGWD